MSKELENGIEILMPWPSSFKVMDQTSQNIVLINNSKPLDLNAVFEFLGSIKYKHYFSKKVLIIFR